MTRAVLGGLYLVVSVGAHAQPTVHFGSDYVSAQGIAPGGEAVFFSVAREQAEWTQRLVPRSEVLPDGDADGVVDYALGSAVPARSTWAVVDLESGEYAVATPPGFVSREDVFDQDRDILPGPQGLLNRLTRRSESVELLVVRPHVGAWTARVTDGGPQDEDQETDERVRVALDTAQTLAGHAPLRRLSANDLVIGIDRRDLSFFAFRFSRTQGGGG